MAYLPFKLAVKKMRNQNLALRCGLSRRAFSNYFNQGGICQGCRISHSNWRSRKLRNQNLALRCSLSCLCWTLSFIISKVFRILRRRGYLERSQISLKRLKTAGLDYHSWISRKIYSRFIVKLEWPGMTYGRKSTKTIWFHSLHIQMLYKISTLKTLHEFAFERNPG